MGLDHSYMLTGLYSHNDICLIAISFGEELFTQLVKLEVVVGGGLLFGSIRTVEEEALIVQN